MSSITKKETVMISKLKYIVPNFCTSCNFLIAVLSLFIVANFFDFGDTDIFILSSYFIVYCVLLDKLDGFFAKILNASSEFGAQFDSLADLVAFGVAPAFIVAFFLKGQSDWYLENKIFIWISSGLYVLCAAIRLAKYNAMDIKGIGSSECFEGMPSTLAGGLNAVFTILIIKYAVSDDNLYYLIASPILLTVTALLMISPFRLPKVKKRKSNIFNAFQIASLIACYVLGFSMKCPEYLFFMLVGYPLVGFPIGLICFKE